MVRLICLILVGTGFLLVSSPAGGEPGNQIPSLEYLLQYEKRLVRKSEGPMGLNPADKFGSDPIKTLYLPARRQYLILLRNRSELLLADRSLNLLDRKGTPRSPTGWALADERFLFVGGELSSEIYLYEITAKGLRLQGKLRLQGVASVRDLLYVAPLQSLFLLDDFDHRLHQLVLAPGWSRQERPDFQGKTFSLGAGPIQIRYQNHHLLVNLLLEHTLLIVPLVRGGPDFSLSSRITHDGPIWDFDAIAWRDSLMIAAGGVENRPLNRLGGEFGHVDSFLFLYVVSREHATGVYRWRPGDRHNSRRFVQQNLSEIGVVTPKALRFASPSSKSADLWVSAFGSPRMARFSVQKGRLRMTGKFNVPPGTTDFVIVKETQPSKKIEQEGLTLVLTNALLDRLYRLEMNSQGADYRAIRGLSSYPSKRSRESRIGELLFFTTLMTPYNRSEGELSRFTCEACHYEGTIDGRVHYTGRGHVFASTKTVRGLANNVPLFSRAGDRSLASMVLAEFRVANQGRKDSFSIKVSEYPWLGEIEGVPAVLSPTNLRKALLAFFVDFQHRPNPWQAQRRKLSQRALQGLVVFRERCEYCHQASLSTRKAQSLPYGNWQGWIEAEGRDLVWGAPFYTKTGIQPYVHKAGARVPSLRRVKQKHPYFTNGSSRTLQELLSRFRYREANAWHHYEPPSAQVESEDVKSLTAEEIASLEEILRFF
ncbi:MAG: hypothetical protein ACE5JO_01210 [Candidatus Binatia bacterium]